MKLSNIIVTPLSLFEIWTSSLPFHRWLISFSISWHLKPILHSEIKIPSLYGHGYSRVDSLHNAWNESYKDHRGDHGEVLPITKLKTTPSTEKTVQCFVLRINGIAHQNVKIYSHSLFYWKSWVSILIRLQNILKKI